ncbi:unnamed protein product [Amoebophrya sp. A25]|nr:unnamed protein product [Amoebophrya sp. A25]|eukprot:GSA25T00012717001.1
MAPRTMGEGALSRIERQFGINRLDDQKKRSEHPFEDPERPPLHQRGWWKTPPPSPSYWQHRYSFRHEVASPESVQWSPQKREGVEESRRRLGSRRSALATSCTSTES